MIDLYSSALVTHKGCPDGAACAVLFEALGGKKENVFFSSPNHQDSDEVVSSLLSSFPGSIILADISISEKLASTVTRNDIVLLDHHRTAIPLAKYPWCEIEVANNRSGARMLYDRLRSEGYLLYAWKEFVELIDDRDRWVNFFSQSADLALLFEIYGQEGFIDRFTRNSVVSFSATESLLLNIENTKRKSYIGKKKKEVEIFVTTVEGRSIRIGFVQAGMHQSALGDSICEDPALDVEAVVIVGEKSISLRGKQRSSVDLSKVAVMNGGGGHYSAAGIPLNNLFPDGIIGLVRDYLKFP
jgi:oligoribonuclease NrnB/cAMP/cGMP phosphodiesterase (DHH superfamily)